jgi:hypothetical protein
LTSETSGTQRALHHVRLAVELAGFLAFGDDRADAGAGVEGRNRRRRRRAAFGQRALRRELQFQLARQVLALELLVLAHVSRQSSS